MKVHINKHKNFTESKSRAFGCVYVMEDQNANVKIGITTNLTKRISSIQSSVICKIVNVGHSDCFYDYKRLEKRMHQHFKLQNVRGEWFKVPFNEAVLKMQEFLNDYDDRPYEDLSSKFKSNKINELKKYVEKNPGVKKTWIAEQLSISKQNLDYYLNKNKEISLPVELKAKVRN